MMIATFRHANHFNNTPCDVLEENELQYNINFFDEYIEDYVNMWIDKDVVDTITMNEDKQMHVVRYLKEFGIEKLEEEFSIKVKRYEEEGLITLNYSQLNSKPESHPIVMECRGLILDTEFNVVSRSFDRFFNIGEHPETQTNIDMSSAVCYEKIDGSLIRIYYWNGLWHIATRGEAFAESKPNGSSLSFRELVLKSMMVSTYGKVPTSVRERDAIIFQRRCNDFLDKDVTYICELVCPENKVVKEYGIYKLFYLSARNNSTYEYVDAAYTCCNIGLGIYSASKYHFDTLESCRETANHLKGLDEGFVLYQNGVPVCKIKSPVYVAAHIRGEDGLTTKRICQIVLIGEHEEYLTYFNQDRQSFTPYINAFENLKNQMQSVYDKVQYITDKKTLALEVKDFPFSGILFQAHKTKEHTSVVFERQSEQSKIRLLEIAVK